MGDRINSAVLSGPRDQIAGLRSIVRHRLVANHVQTRVERGNGEWIVGVVGRHDSDGVGAVGALLFTFEQLSQRGVAPPSIESHRNAAASGTRGVAGKHAADDVPVAVELGGRAVHFPDPCTGSAADDGKPQWAAETGSQFAHRNSFDWRVRRASARIGARPYC